MENFKLEIIGPHLGTEGLSQILGDLVDFAFPDGASLEARMQFLQDAVALYADWQCAKRDMAAAKRSHLRLVHTTEPQGTEP